MTSTYSKSPSPFIQEIKPNTLLVSTMTLLYRQIYITALILSSGFMGEKFRTIEIRSDKFIVSYLEDLVISDSNIIAYANFWKGLNPGDLKKFMFGWMIQISTLKKFPIEIPNKEVVQKKFFSWMCTDNDIPKKVTHIK